MAATNTMAFALYLDKYVDMLRVERGGLRSFVRARRSRTRPKLVYLNGNLLLIAPALPHERLREWLSMFIHEVVVGLRLPIRSVGQSMLHQRRKQVTVEPDFSYYLANEAKVRIKPIIDLRVDPPPDLVVEVVHLHAAIMAVKALRRLRVPEIWVCDGNQLQILTRSDNGCYAKSDRSLSFPFLTCSVIFDWVHASENGSDTDWCIALRQWVEVVLVSRFELGWGKS